MNYWLITTLVLIVIYIVYRWFADRECAPGTSKWNGGGITDISTCRCQKGYGWGATGCVMCPKSTYTDTAGGSSDIRGCNCMDNYGWNSNEKLCYYCFGNTSPNNTGPPDEPGSGCYCPAGTKWSSNECKCM